MKHFLCCTKNLNTHFVFDISFDSLIRMNWFCYRSNFFLSLYIYISSVCICVIFEVMLGTDIGNYLILNICIPERCLNCLSVLRWKSVFFNVCKLWILIETKPLLLRSLFSMLLTRIRIQGICQYLKPGRHDSAKNCRSRRPSTFFFSLTDSHRKQKKMFKELVLHEPSNQSLWYSLSY